MAYCKVLTSRAVSAAINYCERKAGEERKGLIKMGVNCDAENAKQEFSAIKQIWNKKDGVQAHIIIQSFKGKECNAEQANKIGKELADRIATGYQAVVYTHTDSEGGNIHNHIIINSVSLENGKKLNGHGLLDRVRETSNELSRKYGLSVIGDKKAELRYTQAEHGMAKKGQQSWKDEIREVVDSAKKVCRDMDEFRQELGKYGVQITYRGADKKITYTHPNGRKVRAARLGESYTREEIEKALNESKPVIGMGGKYRTALTKVNHDEKEEKNRKKAIKWQEQRVPHFRNAIPEDDEEEEEDLFR